MDEKLRGRFEHFVAYCLDNEYNKKELIEFILYHLSDEELALLVEEFQASSTDSNYSVSYEEAA
jgi:DNA-binding MarR family transcriptional regulator